MATTAPAPRGSLLLHDRRAWIIGALLVVGVSDIATALLDPGFPTIGFLDVPAHAATALLLLAALPPRSRPWLIGFWLGAIGIDVDHVPLFFGSDAISEGTGRPYSHSLLAIALLLGVSAAVARARTLALAVAIGLGTHLVRDLATAAGVALLWPFSNEQFSIFYGFYAAVLVAVAAYGLVRAGGAAPK